MVGDASVTQSKIVPLVVRRKYPATIWNERSNTVRYLLQHEYIFVNRICRNLYTYERCTYRRQSATCRHNTPGDVHLARVIEGVVRSDRYTTRRYSVENRRLCRNVVAVPGSR
ncbi:hypothetical protein D3C81_1146090 [compost metagenome]